MEHGRLNCPCCESILKVVQVGHCHVDRCPGCGGIWFDHEELRVVAAGHQDALAALDAGPADPPLTGLIERSCPRCRQPLHGFPLPGCEGLTADRCVRCKGIWLDGGEVRQAAERRHDPGGPCGEGSAVALAAPAPSAQPAAPTWAGGWSLNAGDVVEFGGAVFEIGGAIVELVFAVLDR